jgi:cytochrome P450
VFVSNSSFKFGAGRRVCLGKHVAILELKKLVPFLLITYEVSSLETVYYTGLIRCLRCKLSTPELIR